MKRSLSAVVVVLALLVPASAPAAGKKYVGEFESGGKIRFKVVRQDGHKVVKRLRWSNIPIACDDGDHTYDASLFIPIRLKRNNVFKAGVLSEDRRTAARIRGEVHRRKADGLLAVDGRIPHDDGVSEGCSTGFAKWRAERA